jgi:hypothetical protein
VPEKSGAIESNVYAILCPEITRNEELLERKVEAAV